MVIEPGPAAATRPRWAAALAIAVVVLIGAGVVALATEDDDEGDGRAAPTTATSTTVAIGDTTSTAPPTTETVPPSTVATTTTTRRATTTTTTRPTTSTSRPATSTTATGVLPVCVASLIKTTVTAERASYRNGETARLLATFENTSGRQCSYENTRVNSQVFDPLGRAFTPVQTLTTPNTDKVPFAPGTSQTFQATWVVSVCSSTATCFPGRYTMVIDVVPFGGGRASVDITA